MVEKDVPIRVFEGFQISYGIWSRKFEAKKGDVKLSADSEEELMALIRQHKKDLRKFKPLEVIKVHDNKVGRITSRVADDIESSVWFSFKDSDGQPKHTKQTLEGYSWGVGAGKAYFVEATEKNLTILGEISELELKIDELEKEIQAKKESYEKPVTWETMDKQAGEA